jgi:hypothetical protein
VSNSLAIAAVTSTMVNLLSDVQDVGGAMVTARPLDRARENVQGHQLNVFLYQTSAHGALRNQELPQSRGGESRRTTPPLALRLHYLVTAIASDDDDIVAQKILGKAMSILHDHGVLERGDIQAALEDAGLHLQVERVRLSPMDLSIEDISKLWTTFQTQYRVTAAYEASAVLIDSTDPAPSPMPVLRRGRHDPEGPTAVAAAGPALDFVGPDLGGAERRLSFPLRPGDRVVLGGARLGGEAARVRFRSARLTEPVDATPGPGSSAERVTVDLPTGLPAGYVTVSTVVERVAGEPWASNQLAVAVAPVITLGSTAVSGPDFSLDVTTTPPLAAGQQPVLLFGDRQVAAASITGDTVTFPLTGVAPGTYTVRLRLDGVDSLPLPAPTPGESPVATAFDASQQVVVS